jgi:hypothetical protein
MAHGIGAIKAGGLAPFAEQSREVKRPVVMSRAIA